MHHQLVAQILVSGALSLLAPISTEPTSGLCRSGLILRSASKHSAIERAGLRPGDRLLGWRSLLQASEDRAHENSLNHIEDWLHLKLQQAPQGTILLTIDRLGDIHEIPVEPGAWQGFATPTLDEAHTKVYLRADSARTAANHFEAAASFEELAQAQTTPEMSAWAWAEAAESWSKAGFHEHARNVYLTALRYASSGDCCNLLTIEILLSLADLLQQNAKTYNLAENSYDAAENAASRLSDHYLVIAQIYKRRADFYWSIQNFQAASKYINEALRIYSQRAPFSMQFAMALNTDGNILDSMGYLREATEQYKVALGILSNLAPESEHALAVLNNMAVVAVNSGDYNRGHDLYQQALMILERSAAKHETIAFIYANLGALEHDRENLDRAEIYFRRSLEIYQSKSPGSNDISRVILNLGKLAISRGDLDSAEHLCTQALEMRRASHSHEVLTCSPLDCLALSAHLKKDFTRAINLSDNALSVARKNAPGSLLLADLLDRRVAIAIEQQDLAIAKLLATEALQIYERIAPQTFFHSHVLHRLAKIATWESNIEKANELFSSAVSIVDDQLLKAYTDEAARGLYRSGRLDLYFNYIIFLTNRLKKPEDAFLVLEHWRAGAFLALLSERDLILSRAPENLEEERSRLAREYDRELKALMSLQASEDSQKVTQIQEKLRMIRKEQEDIISEIRATSPAIAAIQYPQPLTYQEVQLALDPETVILSYIAGAKETYLFIGSSSIPLQFEKIPIGTDDLRNEIELFRDLVQKTTVSQTPANPRSRALIERAQRIYSILLKPAEAAIESGRRLVIIPEGPLHLLPWGALVRQTKNQTNDRNWEYLVEWRPVHLVLSATAYKEALSRRGRSRDNRQKREPALVAFGDPSSTSIKSREIFDDPTRSFYRNLQPLPFSKLEVEKIASLFPALTNIYTGTEATEERVMNIPEGAKYVHFATHAVLSEDIPLHSAIVLALPLPSSEERENGLLQTWEILEQLRLDADLVVLSACESALGKNMGGEGLIGLTRAFQYAGARSVIASLWKISDRTTAELMVRFYKHLKAGKTKDEALRAAQIELIRGPIEITNEKGETEMVDASAPYYWAAFQLYGDWQ